MLYIDIGNMYNSKKWYEIEEEKKQHRCNQINKDMTINLTERS